MSDDIPPRQQEDFLATLSGPHKLPRSLKRLYGKDESENESSEHSSGHSNPATTVAEEKTICYEQYYKAMRNVIPLGWESEPHTLYNHLTPCSESGVPLEVQTRKKDTNLDQLLAKYQRPQPISAVSCFPLKLFCTLHASPSSNQGVTTYVLRLKDFSISHNTTTSATHFIVIKGHDGPVLEPFTRDSLREYSRPSPPSTSTSMARTSRE